MGNLSPAAWGLGADGGGRGCVCPGERLEVRIVRDDPFTLITATGRDEKTLLTGEQRAFLREARLADASLSRQENETTGETSDRV